MAEHKAIEAAKVISEYCNNVACKECVLREIVHCEEEMDDCITAPYEWDFEDNE